MARTQQAAVIRVEPTSDGRELARSIDDAIANRQRPVLRFGGLLSVSLTQTHCARSFARAMETGGAVEIGACGLLAERSTP